MADSQVKTANICNITSSTELRGNGGGTGTFLTNNSIEVYCNGSAYWSGVFFTSGSESLIVGDKYTISFTPYCTNNNVIRVQFCGVADNYTFTSGIRKTITVTAVDTIRTVAFYAGDAVEKTIIIKDIQIEKGETATVYRPYSATGWIHSLRKLTTATEVVESPLYSDGTAITTYTLKGNEEHTGTPSPQNPVMPNGTGDKTANLLNVTNYGNLVTNTYGSPSNVVKTSNAISFKSNSAETYSGIYIPVAQYATIIDNYDDDKQYSFSADITTDTVCSFAFGELPAMSIPVGTTRITKNLKNKSCILYVNSAEANITVKNIMVADSATQYEPYGYKIPISSGGVTTNIYLGSTQTVRQIKRVDLSTLSWTWNAGSKLYSTRDLTDIVYTSSNQELGVGLCEYYKLHIGSGMSSASADGCLAIDTSMISVHSETQTPPHGYFYYALRQAETAAVNEPLMKIGTYADTLSNATAIPTTEGANSITVDTTVQPSEFTATWTGWHDASVKEWDGTQWS